MRRTSRVSLSREDNVDLVPVDVAGIEIGCGCENPNAPQPLGLPRDDVVDEPLDMGNETRAEASFLLSTTASSSRGYKSLAMYSHVKILDEEMGYVI